MNKKFRALSLLIASTFMLGSSTFVTAKTPRQPKLVAVIIIDQFAYHYLPKLKKHFHYGLKELLTNGIVYTNAYHAHGTPETTTGHHALSTGSLPKDHGGILNQWIDHHYKKVCYDLDASPEAATLATGPQSCPDGKSCHNTMVDGLSDQFIFSAAPNSHHKVFALSLKSHPAIATANRLGKAIWFDPIAGNFTSSKKYFTRLPEWVTRFNQEHKISEKTHVAWERMYSKKSVAYQFPDITNYDHAGYKFSIAGNKNIAIDHAAAAPYEMYLKTPNAGKALVELAKVCVDQNFTQASDRMLLWLSLSNLDLVGHFYGPDSLEAIDTIYHLDKQIKEFMDFVRRRVGENNCLFILTADHGIPPIPEIANKRGITIARRVLAKPLMQTMNTQIKQKYNIDEIVKAFEPTFFVLNKEALAICDAPTRAAIITDLKTFLHRQKGIKRVWESDELERLTFAPTQRENFYKMQLYHHRSGDLICMPQPYCLLTNYDAGTSHLSPYEYDLHVPLVLYQKGRFEKKTVTKRVWIPQVPITLARILRIPQPSASMFSHLPESLEEHV